MLRDDDVGFGDIVSIAQDLKPFEEAGDSSLLKQKTCSDNYTRKG
jgi:hypothetical protein